MSTLGNDSGYEPLCNTNRSISKEKSPVSEASRDSSISRDSNITSRDSNITLKGSSISRDSSTSRETASSIEISTNIALQLSKSNNTLAKFRELWWTQGNIHPSAKWEEASDVDWEKYTERTDFFNVHGSWEWINGNVYVYELPLGPHETCSRAIDRAICSEDRQWTLINLGSTRTKADNMGKEADGSFIPKHKPNINSNGRDGSDSHKPWPNLAIEVALSETETHLLDVVKNYWLSPGRAHDAIAVKLVPSDKIVSRIKVWHFCTDNRTLGELVPVTEFGFNTIDDENQILIQPQQFTININAECLFHGMSSDFRIPASIPNPLIIDFYNVLKNTQYMINSLKELNFKLAFKITKLRKENAKIFELRKEKDLLIAKIIELEQSAKENTKKSTKLRDNAKNRTDSIRKLNLKL
ncbi:35793_t:CDS:2, partial [Gigaspora margarita]